MSIRVIVLHFKINKLFPINPMKKIFLLLGCLALVLGAFAFNVDTETLNSITSTFTQHNITVMAGTALAFGPVASVMHRDKDCGKCGGAASVGNVRLPGIDMVIDPCDLDAVNFYPKIKSISATVTVANEGDDAAQRLFFGGALSGATILWQNGSTNATSESILTILSGYRANLGAICFGFSMRAVDASNVGAPDALNDAAPYFGTIDTFGREQRITEFSMGTNQTRADEDTSIEVQFDSPVNITATTFFKYTGKEGKQSFVWYFYPHFKR